MESRLWMSPTLILTFYGWGTGPQEIRLLFQGHGELHNDEENASVVPKLICVPSCWLKKKKRSLLRAIWRKEKNELKVLDLCFFPTKHPYLWTTGALESSFPPYEPSILFPLNPALPRCLLQPCHTPWSRVPECIPECVLGYLTSLTKPPLRPVIH